MAREALYKKKEKTEEKPQATQLAQISKSDASLLKKYFGLSTAQIKVMKPEVFHDYMNIYDYQMREFRKEQNNKRITNK